MKVTIYRGRPTEDGTFGAVFVNGQPKFVSVELPDKNNQPYVSCIPAGTYLCKRVTSPTHGETFEVLDVPNRTDILFHTANSIRDLLGCIGLGRRFGELQDKPAVMTSAVSIKQFMKMMEEHDYFALEIING